MFHETGLGLLGKESGKFSIIFFDKCHYNTKFPLTFHFIIHTAADLNFPQKLLLYGKEQHGEEWNNFVKVQNYWKVRNILAYILLHLTFFTN